MIGYLSGELIWFDQSKIIISVNGVGYEIYYKNNFSSSDLNKSLKVFITHKLSEYGEAMYAFNTSLEKSIFETLDSIKGVGAKVIYTIITELQIDSYGKLPELKLDDLVKLPGVGKSTAQKFLLGLSNKLKKEISLDEIEGGNSPQINIEEKYKEEIDLLVEWGIKKSILVSYLRDNYESLSTLPQNLLIQTLIKELTK